MRSLSTPHYHEVVLQPTDLRTIEEGIKNNKFNHPEEVVRDLYKMLMNSYKFNDHNSKVYNETKEFQLAVVNAIKELHGQQLGNKERQQLGNKEIIQEQTPIVVQTSVHQEPSASEMNEGGGSKDEFKSREIKQKLKAIKKQSSQEQSFSLVSSIPEELRITRSLDQDFKKKQGEPIKQKETLLNTIQIMQEMHHIYEQKIVKEEDPKKQDQVHEDSSIFLADYHVAGDFNVQSGIALDDILRASPTKSKEKEQIDLNQQGGNVKPVLSVIEQSIVEGKKLMQIKETVPSQINSKKKKGEDEQQEEDAPNLSQKPQNQFLSVLQGLKNAFSAPLRHFKAYESCFQSLHGMRRRLEPQTPQLAQDKKKLIQEVKQLKAEDLRFVVQIVSRGQYSVGNEIGIDFGRMDQKVAKEISCLISKRKQGVVEEEEGSSFSEQQNMYMNFGNESNYLQEEMQIPSPCLQHPIEDSGDFGPNIYQ